MDGFTALTFGLCAALVNIHGQDVVELGNVIVGECTTFAYIGDSHGQTAVIQGHDIGISIEDELAVVFVDDRKFVLPKLSGA